MKINLKKNIPFYVLSFLIPLLCFLIIFLFKQILIGKFSYLMSDLEYQYYPLLVHLKRFFLGINNIFYSFHMGLGSSTIGTFSYYLSSIFNVVISFFRIENIYIATFLIIVTKFSLCGITMFTFLKYHFKNKNPLYLLLFSSAYALSLFNIANYFQIIWFDAVLLAPLLLLGIDKIVDKNKPLLYGIILFGIIFSNYYMGYMCCLFSILYFLYRLILSKEKNKKRKVIHFFIVSLLAGCMTMIISLPTVIKLFELNRVNVVKPFFNTDILGILSKLFIGSHATEYVLNRTHPFLYCGIFLFPLLVFYFFNKKITKKEKIFSFFMIFIFTISILINPINNFWHVFSNPIGFNYRYTYLFILFIIYLSCKSFFQLKYIEKKIYYMVAPIIPILGVCVYFRKLVPLPNIYLTVILSFLYFFLYYHVHRNKDLKIILIFLVLSELYFNMHFIFLNLDYNYKENMLGRYQEKTSSIETIKQYDSSPFYRIEFDHNYGFNDPIFEGYNGASVWLSTVDDKREFFQKIGYLSKTNQYNYSPYFVLDSLFGIKYLETTKFHDKYNEISRKEISFYDGVLYNTLHTNAMIYANPYALSLGYKVMKTFPLQCMDILDCQNVLLKDMTGNDLDVFEKEEVKEFSFTIDKDLDFYLDFIKEENTLEEYSYNIYINDELYMVQDSESFGPVLVDNKYDINQEIQVKIEIISGEINITDVHVYYLNFDNFIKQYEILKQNQLQIDIFQDGYVKGKIEMEEKGTLFLSIPYEKGWNSYVDGKKIEYEEVYGAFIGIELEAGKHDIELEYKTPGLKIGAFISISSFILFISYIYMNKKTIID